MTNWKMRIENEKERVGMNGGFYGWMRERSRQNEVKGISVCSMDANEEELKSVDMEAHDKRFHGGEYKEGQRCKYREDLAKLDKADNIGEEGKPQEEGDKSTKEYDSRLQEILKNAPRDYTGNLLAPNGKPSNLTERQYAQVRTKEFKDWFGDWENDPANASKVVDENGEPKVVYHGTKNKGFTVFSSSRNGVFFSADRWNAYAYTPKQDYDNRNDVQFNNPKDEGYVYPVFLNIINPYVADGQGNDWDEILLNGRKRTTDSIAKAVRKNSLGENNDGVIFNNVYDVDTDTQYNVFSPNQIKSATDNRGTFSVRSADIRY